MTLLFVGLALVLAGGVCAALFPRSARGDRLHDVFVLGGCIVSGAAAAIVLATGRGKSFTMPATTPGGAWAFGLDALSAVLVLAIAAAGGAAALYATHYGRAEGEGTRVHGGGSKRVERFIFASMLVAMWLVVVARAVVPFLVSWELMAITSYLALVVDHDRPEVRRAGLIYLVATHTGTLLILVMFAVWIQPATSWSFSALAEAAPLLPHGGAVILTLALAGFGFKAGMVPLHFWLPPAHAAAPTPTSAVLSGVVIKLGIYGMLRVLLLVGSAPAWWGWLVLGIGTASGILGVLWALAQHDLKRLLAYHSVENIGIILMGVGVGALGSAYQVPAVAIVGYAGAVLHTLNHALFKSLLFLGAGAVQRSTGTRDLEQLGGLARLMPFTWITFAVASAAIVGVPPFNGFVSEWLVYRGLFNAGLARDLLRLAVAGIPALALIGGLALACFAKVCGVVFLGTARTARAERAREAEPGMLRPMWALALACVAIGVLPSLGVAPSARAAADIAGTDQAPALTSALAGSAAISAVAVLVSALVAVLWLVRLALGRAQPVRQAGTWGCGFGEPTPRMQYTASSFAAPLLSLFRTLSGVRTHRTPRALHTVPHDPVLDGVVAPLWDGIHRAAGRLRPIQQGRLHVYLLYVVFALLVLLVYLAFGARA